MSHEHTSAPSSRAGSLKRRIAYSVAAASAAQQAAAGIVYVDPADISIPFDTVFSYGIEVDNADMGAFGGYDIFFTNSSIAGSPYQGGFGIGGAAFVNKIAGAFSISYIRALTPGFMVDYGAGFGSAGSMALSFNPNAEFTTPADVDKYLGFRFMIAGNTHYAWMRVNIDNANANQNERFTVKDWAYESSAGVGIAVAAVPETGVVGALGLIAAGSTGLGVLRKRRQAAA